MLTIELPIFTLPRRFKMTYSYNIPGCHSGFLEIRDGYWHKSELLGKWFSIIPCHNKLSRLANL